VVLAGAQQDVDPVHAGGSDIDEHLVVTDLGAGDIGETHGFGPPELVHLDRLHPTVPFDVHR
jgi:hypothetical protein